MAEATYSGHRTSSTRVLVLFLLIASVFAWGLHYKLSLYKAAEQVHPTSPAAKLLSPKELPAQWATELPKNPLEKFPSVVLALFLLPFFLLAFTPSAIVDSPPLFSRLRLRCIPAIASRPPPACV